MDWLVCMTDDDKGGKIFFFHILEISLSGFETQLHLKTQHTNLGLQELD